MYRFIGLFFLMLMTGVGFVNGQNASFAVVARFDQPSITHTSTSSLSEGYGLKAEISLSEKIYVLNSDGQIKPFLKLTNSFKESLLNPDGKRNSIIDKDVLKQYFEEPAYTKMMEYVKQEDLNMDDREHYIKALSFYKQVTEGN